MTTMTIELEIAGVRVELLPGRGMLVHDTHGVMSRGGPSPASGPARVLMVADVHLGKAAAMAATGLPVSGELAARIARADLDRLTALVARTSAGHVVVLGDLLHARTARDEEVVQAVAAWREQDHCATGKLRITLVRGNHDRRAGDPPAEWQMECVDGPWPAEGPIACVHEPEERQDCAGRYRIGGHVHPTVTIGDGGDRLRAACFVIGRGRAVLPAFGRFTGGVSWRVCADASGGDSVFAAGDEAVLAVPVNAGAARRGKTVDSGGPENLSAVTTRPTVAAEESLTTVVGRGARSIPAGGRAPLGPA